MHWGGGSAFRAISVSVQSICIGLDKGFKLIRKRSGTQELYSFKQKISNNKERAISHMLPVLWVKTTSNFFTRMNYWELRIQRLFWIGCGGWIIRFTLVFAAVNSTEVYAGVTWNYTRTSVEKSSSSILKERRRLEQEKIWPQCKTSDAKMFSIAHWKRFKRFCWTLLLHWPTELNDSPFYQAIDNCTKKDSVKPCFKTML